MPEIIDLSMPVHMWMERYPGTPQPVIQMIETTFESAARIGTDKMGFPELFAPQRVHLQRALWHPHRREKPRRHERFVVGGHPAGQMLRAGSPARHAGKETGRGHSNQ